MYPKFFIIDEDGIVFYTDNKAIADAAGKDGCSTVINVREQTFCFDGEVARIDEAEAPDTDDEGPSEDGNDD